MAALWCIVLLTYLYGSIEVGSRSTKGTELRLPPVPQHQLQRPTPDVWNVTVFEHGNYKGRQLTIGGDWQWCHSLNNTRLCSLDDASNCTTDKQSAAQSVSSIKFNHGSCIRVYRDLHCYGSYDQMRDTFYSCASNFYNEKCYDLNDVIGSVTGCNYGECTFNRWSASALRNLLDSLPISATGKNITAVTLQLEREVEDNSKRLTAETTAMLFLGHTVDQRYSNEEIGYLNKTLNDLDSALKTNSTYVLSGIIDPEQTLANFGARAIKKALETIVDQYMRFGKKARHVELRQLPNLFPNMVVLNSGDVVFIDYENHGGVTVQTALTVTLRPSQSNRLRCTRTTFYHTVARFAARMEEMDYIPGTDERGHLIASCLGGAADVWNLAPQTIQLNRGNGRGENWRIVENRIRVWLRKANCNFVDWHLQIRYRGGSNRPYLFLLTARFMSENANGQVVQDSATLLICNNLTDNVSCMEQVLT
jgi:hypothetical protein